MTDFGYTMMYEQAIPATRCRSSGGGPGDRADWPDDLRDVPDPSLSPGDRGAEGRDDADPVRQPVPAPSRRARAGQAPRSDACPQLGRLSHRHLAGQAEGEGGGERVAAPKGVMRWPGGRLGPPAPAAARTLRPRGGPRAPG